jgi:hypothetical protein
MNVVCAPSAPFGGRIRSRPGSRNVKFRTWSPFTRSGAEGRAEEGQVTGAALPARSQLDGKVPGFVPGDDAYRLFAPWPRNRAVGRFGFERFEQPRSQEPAVHSHVSLLGRFPRTSVYDSAQGVRVSPEDTPSAAAAAVLQSMITLIGVGIAAFGIYWFANWALALLAFAVALFGLVMVGFGLFGLAQTVAASVRRNRP